MEKYKYTKQDLDNLMYKDYRNKESRKIINEELLKLKYFKEYRGTGKKIPLKKIEDFAAMIVRRKKITPQWINMMYKEDLTYYSCSIKTDADGKHTWLGNATACNFYELAAKMALFLFHAVKIYNIKDRDEERTYYGYANYDINEIEEKYNDED